MADRWQLVPATRAERRALIASWWVWRFRTLAREEGVQVAARRLRKYGVPLQLAVRILGIEPTAIPWTGRR